MRLFVANVGVNTDHARRYGLRSPVFPDGRFEFVPIKERSDLAGLPGIPTYADLKAFNRESRKTLAAFVPPRLLEYVVHSDPEFENYTYGDIESPRAAALASVRVGDELWFVARLWHYDQGRWTGRSGFHLIGFFAVCDNLFSPGGQHAADITSPVIEAIKENAHYKRLQCAGEESPFRIIVGDRDHSRRFLHAIEVTPEVAGHIYGGLYDPSDGLYRQSGRVLLNKNGRPRTYETFGSVTRSIQCFLDSKKEIDRIHAQALARLAEGSS